MNTDQEPCTHTEFQTIPVISRDVIETDKIRELHATIIIRCPACKMQFYPVEMNDLGQVVFKPFVRGK